MSEVTRILSSIEQGDLSSAEKLLPLVYDELRRLAADRLAREKPDQTLQATALVHEAYLRLVQTDKPPSWNSRGHFFAAAAEAMRRILVENARRKKAEKHGGDRRRVDLAEVETATNASPESWLHLDDALARFNAEDPDAAEIARLRLFAGLSIEEAAEVVNVSRATAFRHWTYARAWLQAQLQNHPPAEEK